MAVDDRATDSGSMWMEDPVAGRTDAGTGPSGRRRRPTGGEASQTVDFLSPTPEDGGGPRETPSFLANYDLLQRLDPGGQADVFLARDRVLNRLVVIKRYRGDADRLQDLLHEGRALAGIKNPFVANCLAADRWGDEVVLIIEYIAGKNLEEVYAHKPPRPAVAARLVEQVAEGLTAAHELCVTHLDLKPANVVLGDDGVPRLIDFGLSFGPRGSPEGSIRGSAPYMAPEQARGEAEHVGIRTDVFGLGTLLHFLLTGRPPYEGGSLTEILEHARSRDLVPPRQRNPKVPRALEAVCLKAMAAAPERRFSSADEFRKALRRARLRARKWALGAASGVMALALGLPLALSWRPGPAALLAVELSAERFHYDDRTGRFLALGRLGDDVVSARLDDDIRVRFRLSAPAYCYLLALNPDGTSQLCLPADAGSRPVSATELVFPPDEEDYYGLTPKYGTGMQAFVLIASRAPLPPYASWGPAAGLPWAPAAGEGVWEFDGRAFHLRSASGRRSPDRGDVRRRPVAPEPLLAVCRELGSAPGVDLVRGISFPVVAE